jgi:hypothetical protein
MFDGCCVMQPSVAALYLYDAVYLYLKTINRAMMAGHDFRNGSAILENAKEAKFSGESESIGPPVNEYMELSIRC